jgi:hypothetical protein
VVNDTETVDIDVVAEPEQLTELDARIVNNWPGGESSNAVEETPQGLSN